MTRRSRIRAAAFVVSLIHGLSVWASPERDFTVAAVQLSIPGDRVVERPVFEEAIRAAVHDVYLRGAPDLLVFPEYTSVFPTLTPFADLVAASDSIHELLVEVSRNHAEISTPLDAFARFSDESEEYLDRFWGGLARELGVAIIAGSYFAVHETMDGRRELRNRMLYYHDSGRRAYVQDKVYPTAFEYEFLNLRPGVIARADPLPITGARVGVSICNDTFYKRWERRFASLDLWIDIKANNAVFTDETRALFRRALPERISGDSGTYGLTVCLGGTFLDLFWEGPTSFIRGRRKGYHVLSRAPSPDAPAILIAELARADNSRTVPPN